MRFTWKCRTKSRARTYWPVGLKKVGMEIFIFYVSKKEMWDCLIDLVRSLAAAFWIAWRWSRADILGEEKSVSQYAKWDKRHAWAFLIRRFKQLTNIFKRWYLLSCLTWVLNDRSEKETWDRGRITCKIMEIIFSGTTISSDHWASQIWSFEAFFLHLALTESDQSQVLYTHISKSFLLTQTE